MKKPFPTLLGYTLFRLRNNAKFTQRDLARRARECYGEADADEDAWITFISRLESGEHKGTQDQRKLIALARALGVHDQMFVNLAQPLPANLSTDMLETIVESLPQTSRRRLKDILANQPADSEQDTRMERINNLHDEIARMEKELQLSSDWSYRRQLAIHLSKNYSRLSEELKLLGEFAESEKVQEVSQTYRQIAIDEVRTNQSHKA